MVSNAIFSSSGGFLNLEDFGTVESALGSEAFRAKSKGPWMARSFRSARCAVPLRALSQIWLGRSGSTC